jgi:hypothetical protein
MPSRLRGRAGQPSRPRSGRVRKIVAQHRCTGRRRRAPPARNAGMIYGYARVSTDAQDYTSQLAQLKAAGCESIPREDHRHDRRMAAASQADHPANRRLLAAERLLKAGGDLCLGRNGTANDGDGSTERYRESLIPPRFAGHGILSVRQGEPNCQTNRRPHR